VKVTTSEAAFFARLQAILDVTKKRMEKLRDPTYELRVMTVRKHNVKAHTRQTFQKVYLAKRKRTPKARAHP
jgi:hypothetical protein